MSTTDSPLVSVITPCYNGETYVRRFLDSVLCQTYNNIELIFVNDGSTDKTEEIVLSYKPKFKTRGINFIYIYQENGGQASALNKGLKIFKGEYMTWPDSDDILYENSIESRVNFLEVNKDMGLVLCKADMLEETGLKLVRTRPDAPVNTNDLFLDLINNDYTPIFPGHMVRMTAFLNAMPKRDIYESREGQNLQLLLPLTFSCKTGFLNEVCIGMVERNDSHSRCSRTAEEQIARSFGVEKIFFTVIKEMNISNEEYYLDLVKKRYEFERAIIKYRYELIDLTLKWSGNIVVFGAGKDGRALAKDSGEIFNKLLFFIDANPQKQVKGILIKGRKINVFSVENALSEIPPEAAIVISSRKYGKEMYNELITNEIKNKIFLAD